MRFTKEQLEDFYRQETARSVRGKADCLPEELLLRAAASELTPEERHSVLGHLSTCSDCAREYRLARSSKQWASEVAPTLVGRSDAPYVSPAQVAHARPLAAIWNKIMFVPTWRAAALAAMVVITAGVSLVVWRAMQPVGRPEPLERGSAGLVIKVDPPDRAQLSEAPRRLTWSEVQGAEGYEVALYDFELTLIWESPQVNDPSIQIPDSVRTVLKGPIYWRVIITSGVERRQSDLFQFLLAPNEQR